MTVTMVIFRYFFCKLAGMIDVNDLYDYYFTAMFEVYYV